MSDAPNSSPTGTGSEGSPKAGQNPPAPPAAPSTPNIAGGSRGSGRGWLFVALAFLVGLIIGGIVIGLAKSSGTSTATPNVTVTVAPSTTPASASSATRPDTIATVRVPAECLQVADDSRKVADLANQAVAAARDLDAAKLSDLVRQIGEAQASLTQHGDACREVSATVTAVPSASGTPSSGASTSATSTTAS